ncbi:carbohydrate ABC transporter substrate-binding protein [Xylanibacillus composti]|uniref:ABC transporter substrate-binding protein n=1 Tax=Xylanibacillus composti TaxID=1572762 RepID=A0A8J4M3P4_9BACL|nr:ABC transporter substrate-binding protein [Xylanibacillus composti]MDT9724025.1 carbohydrate ABC transporter substrate-binding protein [Xylanibacillus composti]GIQ71070.1 ABC transporter substrate-binding protein [Xylanibacillus composti]
MKAWIKKRHILPLVVVMLLTLVLSACGGGGNGGNDAGQNQGQGNAGGNAGTGGEGSYLERAYAGEFSGTKVTMFGPFTDEDEVKFLNAIAAFEEQSGIDIAYEGSKEFEATISVRVNGGNAPDIADFPQPGLLETFVRDGHVIDVRSFMSDDWLNQQYNESWLDMATMEGPNGDIMAGIWSRSGVKSLVWYNKNEFEAAGYEVPTTWDELIDLSEQIAADGDAAWAIGIESGAATGWPATDWIEDIMLRTTTPENYDKWVSGELPFTDPIVKNAFERMAEIWMNPDYVYGGTKSIVTTYFGDAPKPLFTNPPGAYLHRQASFITTFFPPEVTADDYDWFPFPPIDEQYGTPALISGDLYAMFNDRPEVRAVMEFFTTGESIRTWVQSGGVIAPMNDAELDWYPTETERRMAELVQNAETVRFDGSDLMPGSVGAGTFWKGITDYVSGTVDLDTALQEMQRGWQQ